MSIRITATRGLVGLMAWSTFLTVSTNAVERETESATSMSGESTVISVVSRSVDRMVGVRGEDEQNWPNWRGPDATGVAKGESYPVEFSADTNVVWQYPLPGLGASTPILWGDSIIMTCEQDGKNCVLSVSRDGDLNWDTSLGELVAARNRKASGCNSSPVTDGELIFAYFKSGELACLNFSGEVVWQTNLQERFGEDTLWWDLGTSPVLTDDDVVIACMQTGGSYLVAFNKQSGELHWKHDRNLESPGEAAQSYTTPVVIDDGDGETIIVLGADHLTAHNSANGEMIWQVGGLNPNQARNWRSISSPVVGDGVVFAPYARGNSLTAIRLGGRGDVTESHVAWSNDGPAADVPTPVFDDGKVYVCTDRGGVFQFNAEDGEVEQSLDLSRGRRATFSSSPVLAGGHLYLTSEEGVVYVVRIGDSLELVAENAMNDFAVATPIFCDGRIYIRTDAYLHCIGDASR